MNRDWKTKHLFRMLPRALLHMKEGKAILAKRLDQPGVYVLYRDDEPWRHDLLRKRFSVKTKPVRSLEENRFARNRCVMSVEPRLKSASKLSELKMRNGIVTQKMLRKEQLVKLP